MKSPTGSNDSSAVVSAAASSSEAPSGVSADSATSSASVVAAVSTASASLTASSWSSGDSDTITLSLVRGCCRMWRVSAAGSAEQLHDQPREQVVEPEHDR